MHGHARRLTRSRRDPQRGQRRFLTSSRLQLSSQAFTGIGSCTEELKAADSPGDLYADSSQRGRRKAGSVSLSSSSGLRDFDFLLSASKQAKHQ